MLNWLKNLGGGVVGSGAAEEARVNMAQPSALSMGIGAARLVRNCAIPKKLPRDEIVREAQRAFELSAAQEGFLSRQLLQTEDEGVWLDLMHFNSPELLQKARQFLMAEMQRPGALPYLAWTEDEKKSDRLFLEIMLVHLGKSREPVGMACVVEMLTPQDHWGNYEKTRDLFASTKASIEACDGLISRQVACDVHCRTWLDIQYWRDEASCRAAEAPLANDPRMKPYLDFEAACEEEAYVYRDVTEIVCSKLRG